MDASVAVATLPVSILLGFGVLLLLMRGFGMFTVAAFLALGFLLVGFA